MAETPTHPPGPRSDQIQAMVSGFKFNSYKWPQPLGSVKKKPTASSDRSTVSRYIDCTQKWVVRNEQTDGPCGCLLWVGRQGFVAAHNSETKRDGGGTSTHPAWMERNRGVLVYLLGLNRPRLQKGIPAWPHWVAVCLDLKCLQIVFGSPPFQKYDDTDGTHQVIVQIDIQVPQASVSAKTFIDIHCPLVPNRIIL